MYLPLCIPSLIAFLGDPHNNEHATSDAYKTLFIGRLAYSTTEAQVRREFERYGPIRSIRMVTVKGEEDKPRGYAFIEYEREKDMRSAYVDADGMRLEGRRIVVDVERGRTVKGWRPRRLGGGLGKTRVGSKEQNQRYSGRDPRAMDKLEGFIKSNSDGLSRKRSPSPSSRHHERNSDYHHHRSHRH